VPGFYSARSPELATTITRLPPLDFRVLGDVKDLIHESKVDTREKIIRWIVDKAARVDDRVTFPRVICSVLKPAGICIETGMILRDI
jgi:hypothetical protein